MQLKPSEYLSERIPYMPDGECVSGLVRRLEKQCPHDVFIGAIKHLLKHKPGRIELTSYEDYDLAYGILNIARSWQCKNDDSIVI